MMEVRFVVQKGSKRSRVVTLRRDEILIGRRQDCDLRIESSEVSRRHCMIAVQESYLTIEDLDSVNGTFLNGKRVSGKQPVRPGDRLEIGPVCFVVEYNAPGAPTRVLPKSSVTRPQEEPLDVLPLVEEEEDEEIDVLPLASMSVPAKESPSDSVLEALEVAEELDSNPDWHLPENDELRDLLSDMDSDVKKKKGRKP